jgi:ureidoglycolate hydrolase
MNIIRLKPKQLTRKAFAPFGILLDQRGSVDIDLGGGAVEMTGATSDPRPFVVEHLSRHRKTMQVFSPLAGSQAVIVVAPPNDKDKPDVEKIVAFHINGRLPYAYHIGTWHAPPFALGDWYSYLVVDRSGTLDDDWEMVDLKNALDVTIEIEL